MRTHLSVNLNKIAVLRNSRGGALPSVLEAARVCLAAGCDGLTVHPRPDQRHIRPDDVEALAIAFAGETELNIEGNPIAGSIEGAYPGFLAIVEQARPAQATLVPDGDAQLTSDHGFDLRRDGARLLPLIDGLKRAGIRVSLFMDAGSPDIERAAEIGADRIEIYTGPYAHAFLRGDYARELELCAETARRAQAAGMGVNAGHDLDQRNLGTFLRGVEGVLEVSIGHALIGEAVYDGLAVTVANYLRVIAHATA